MVRVGVLASGNGTNFAALNDACRSGYVGAEIACVVSDRLEARVLERASAAGVEGVLCERSSVGSRDAYDELLCHQLEARDVEVVCCAGFMRILGPRFCKTFADRVFNVHPSLLPAFPGAHAVRDAWEWGVKTTGCTVHFLTEDLDMGPIVVQETVQVTPDDTLETLSRKVHLAEYVAYPKAVKLYATGGLRIEGRRVVLSGDVDAPPWAGGVPPSLEGEI